MAAGVAQQLQLEALAHRRVLVVDDDEMNRMIMSTKLTQSAELKQLGLEVHQVSL